MQSVKLKLVLKVIAGLITIWALLFLAVMAWSNLRQRLYPPQNVTVIVTPQPTPSPTPTVQPTAAPVPTQVRTASPTPQALPAEINLDVPFTVQAPFANWDEFHGEACEEASILMAAWYALGKSGTQQNSYTNQIPPQEADDALLALGAWEDKTFGYNLDLNTAETARVGTENLKLNDVTVTETVTAATIKAALAQEKIVIIPAAGRELGNPYFRQPGPPYHMLVIRGYNKNGFITNDPGTRRGEGYVYKESILINAVHDWTGSTSTITSGRKVMIVVGKN